MDPTRSSGEGSGNSGDYAREIADNDQFHEEIQSLFEPAPENGSSFTALLGLPASQAMELLHAPGTGDSSAANTPTPAAAAAEIWRLRPGDQKPFAFPFASQPAFPSHADLVEWAARYSGFAAAEDSPQTTSSGPSNSGAHSPKLVKDEPADSDSSPNSPPASRPPQRPAKRKELEKSKAKGAGAKKGKNSSEDGTPKPTEGNKGGGEKLPYVHVRARRGQATDSHSLAERARREKINARMKLLQELVPGCSKISGTALVLDEIINHVQSLQRQVEFLSMRLAAVNPRIDFSGLDSFFAAEEDGRMTTGNVGSTVGLETASLWPEVQVDGVQRRQQQQQIWHVDLLPPPPPQSSSPSPVWGRDDNLDGFVAPGPGASLFSYRSVNSVPLQVNQLKMEL